MASSPKRSRIRSIVRSASDQSAGSPEGQLLGAAGHQAAGADAEQADAHRHVERRQQLLGGPGDGPPRVDGVGQGHRAGDGAEVAEAHLERRPCARPGPRARSRRPTASARRISSRARRVVVVVVLGEGLLVADRLERLVGHDRPVVDAVGQRVQVAPAGVADRGHEGVERQGGQVADGGDAEAVEPLVGLRARRPTAPGRAGGGGRPARRRRHDHHAPARAGRRRARRRAWPPPRPAWPGTSSGPRRPSRLRPSSSRTAGPDLRRRSRARCPSRRRAPPTSRKASSSDSGSTSGVNECEDRHDPAAHLAVALVVAGEEHGVGAEPPGPAGGHGRVDAVGPGLVAGRGHHAPVAGPADDHRPARQARVAVDLDGHEERVHVHVQDRRRPRRPRSPVTPALHLEAVEVAAPHDVLVASGRGPARPRARRPAARPTQRWHPSSRRAALVGRHEAGVDHDAVGVVDDQVALVGDGPVDLDPQAPAQVRGLGLDLVDRALPLR